MSQPICIRDIHPALPGAQSACDNCGNIYSDENLAPIADFFDRVSPGETMPSGECPECGALCSPMNSSFLHAPLPKQPRIVIHVHGGCVQAVMTSLPSGSCHLTVVDDDNLASEGRSDEAIMAIWNEMTVGLNPIL